MHVKAYSHSHILQTSDRAVQHRIQLDFKCISKHILILIFCMRVTEWFITESHWISNACQSIFSFSYLQASERTVNHRLLNHMDFKCMVSPCMKLHILILICCRRITERFISVSSRMLATCLAIHLILRQLGILQDTKKSSIHFCSLKYLHILVFKALRECADKLKGSYSTFEGIHSRKCTFNI